MIGVTSSNTLRNNSRDLWRPRAGAQHVSNTAIRRVCSPLRPCGRVPADVHGCPEAWPRSGDPRARKDTLVVYTGKKRPYRRTMPRDARPTRPSDFRLLAMASPSWMLVGSH